MYKLEDLTKYDYFKDVDIAYALDSLTGVVARGYILGFAKHLVENKIPFMMGIMDIDNFKLVNDNYGHKFGDECLKSIGTNLINYVGSNGLVGRYGGDEFIIIHFGPTDYQSVRTYISDLYNNGTVVRRRLKFGKVEFYITSTTGCASFPKDSDNYDDLFLTVDKALYRGKTKGRNCFIIYVEEKHKNIDVHKKEDSSLAIIFKNLFNMINDFHNTDVDGVIKNIMEYVCNTLQLSQVSFVSPEGKVISSGTNEEHKIDGSCIDILEKISGDDEVFAPLEIRTLKAKDKKAAKFIDDRKILALAISKVKSYKYFYGFILFFETKIERIWQEKDVALLMYVDRLIYILINERK